MSGSILIGIFWHFVGAASAACFYAPLKKVKNWSWETMWAVAGLFSWIILPWLVSFILLPDFFAYYQSISYQVLIPVFLFGAMWGIGNINYGLTMRYLGMSMGIGIAIGITLIVGTLMTPLLQGKFTLLIMSAGGRLTLFGVVIAVIGVAIVSYAGLLKERVLGIKAEEFDLKKGLVLAVMCGFFSAGMSFAMDAATPMHQAAAEIGIDPLYVALPSYVVIMGGGAVVNFAFCIVRLIYKKDLSFKADMSVVKTLFISNAIFASIGGVMWYLQFFFYAWGHANIPADHGHMSWMLHMSFYVLCGGIVGLILKEWLGVGRKPLTILIIGMLTIILAANIVGLGMV